MCIRDSSVDALVAFAGAGGGVAFCGELAIRYRLRGRQVVAVPLRDREMNERHFEAVSYTHLTSAVGRQADTSANRASTASSTSSTNSWMERACGSRMCHSAVA